MDSQPKTTLDGTLLEALSTITLATLPLLLAEGDDVKEVLGNGTLFEAEGRLFVVTALHIVKTNKDDLTSSNVDFGDVAFPDAPGDRVPLWTMGNVRVWPPVFPDIDVVVLEVMGDRARCALRTKWRPLALRRAGRWLAGARFVLAGTPTELTRSEGLATGQHVVQRPLAIFTDELAEVPKVDAPSPRGWDRFLLLERNGDFLREEPDVYSLPAETGTIEEVPELRGLSGAAIWCYSVPKESGLLIAGRDRLAPVAVECSVLAGKWIRGTDWDAVQAIMRAPGFGLAEPP